MTPWAAPVRTSIAGDSGVASSVTTFPSVVVSSTDTTSPDDDTVLASPAPDATRFLSATVRTTLGSSTATDVLVIVTGVSDVVFGAFTSKTASGVTPETRAVEPRCNVMPVAPIVVDTK